tara:strand:- start:256 stop:486 length:231 start_codon:yes stop_codon:yes gene_type:complete
MFELADWLIGIYKTDNVTKSVTIDPHAFVIPAAVEQPATPPSAAPSIAPSSSSPSVVGKGKAKQLDENSAGNAQSA